jgi:hypothetical protein
MKRLGRLATWDSFLGIITVALVLYAAIFVQGVCQQLQRLAGSCRHVRESLDRAADGPSDHRSRD